MGNISEDKKSTEIHQNGVKNGKMVLGWVVFLMGSGELHDIYSVYSLLRKNLCRVIFKKVTNGSVRVMLCSLSLEHIPKNKHQEAILLISDPRDVFLKQKVVVWDIESNDWRSFYENTLLSASSVALDDEMKKKTNQEEEHNEKK
jgi:hypothetical protein